MKEGDLLYGAYRDGQRFFQICSVEKTESVIV